MKNLNIGCGRDIRKTSRDFMDRIGGKWVFGDKFPAHDWVERMTLKEIPYPDNAFDNILCEHVIEHVHHSQLLQVSKEWKRVLKTNGMAFVTVPDMEWAFKQWLNVVKKCDFKKVAIATDYIWGGPNQGDYHRSGYSKNIFEEVFKVLEFKIIRCERVLNENGNGEIRIQVQNISNS